MERDPQLIVAVLASPPRRTTGDRTRARLHIAAEILGYKRVTIVNLINIATDDVLGIATVGDDPSPWLAAQPPLAEEMGGAGAVLFGWGCAEPTGVARTHHRAQVDWLTAEAAANSLPMWTVGGVPRHPSRWQRHTVRAFPGLPFADALAMAFRRLS